MSLLYGIWRPQACSQTTDDCAYFANAFADWKCDYAGSTQLGPVAFGSRVFRIYSESANERQPIEDKQRQVMLIADCRLDNREELASALSLDSATLKQTPDSELILNAYQRWGKDCFKRLEGDFAIALWDQTKQELLLVRDVMGLRPLAYATWQDGFAFCSSIPELYQLPFVPPELDEIKMAALFVNHPTGRERTAFESIKWVHPGMIITFRDGHLTKQTFAEITPITLSKEDQKNPAPHLSELLKQSVQKRIRGDGDIVCELSGGFDSGSITALAATLLKDSPREVRAISWAPDPKFFPLLKGTDERRQIEWMKKRYQIDCRYVPLRLENELLGDIAFKTSFRQRATHTYKNAKTLLSGWGGDECVTYYLRPFHPQCLLADGPQATFRRLKSEFKDSKLGHRAILTLLRSLKATWNTANRKKQLSRTPLESVDALLQDTFRQILAQSHLPEIQGDLCLQGSLKYRDTLLTRGHLEFRIAKEALDAANGGKSIAYPMLDPALLSFVTALPAHHFHYNSTRRPLFRDTLDHLDIVLSPNTQKRDTAFSHLAADRPTEPLSPKLKTLSRQYLHSEYADRTLKNIKKAQLMQLSAAINLQEKKSQL